MSTCVQEPISLNSPDIYITDLHSIKHTQPGFYRPSADLFKLLAAQKTGRKRKR